MNFLGLGNSGSRLLRDYHAFFHRSSELPTRRGMDRFLVGDADTNNNVIHDIRVKGLADLPQPRGITVLDLPGFWSGGCGVYHIIGELLASTAFNSEQIRRQLGEIGIEPEAKPPIMLLMGLGGGTGGGVGGHLCREGAPSFTHNQLRALTVLPETDQFVSGGTQITGPDSFQLNSAGRFLVRFLSQASRGGAGPDLLLLSNGYLLPAPKPTGQAPQAAAGIGYQDRVERLNDYFARALALLTPWAERRPPSHGLITFGVGAVRVAEGAPGRPAPGAAGLARQLVRSALAPVELESSSVTGLSALPMAKSEYAAELDQLYPASPAPVKPLGPLAAMFRKCRSVRSRLVIRKGCDAAGDELTEQVQEQLRQVFPGVAVEEPEGPDAADEAMLTDRVGAGAFYDVALILIVEELLVEDVYRLINYYLQSSFVWKRGKEGSGTLAIASLVKDLLADRTMNQDQIYKRLTKTGSLHIGHPVEVYAPRFWGNIDDLQSKVLSSLDMESNEFTAKLVKVEEVADALAYLQERIWRRSADKPWVIDR